LSLAVDIIGPPCSQWQTLGLFCIQCRLNTQKFSFWYIHISCTFRLYRLGYLSKHCYS